MKPPVHAVNTVKDTSYCGITHEELYGQSRLDTWTYKIDDVTCEDCKELVALENLARLGWNEEYRIRRKIHYGTTTEEVVSPTPCFYVDSQKLKI